MKSRPMVLVISACVLCGFGMTTLPRNASAQEEGRVVETLPKPPPVRSRTRPPRPSSDTGPNTDKPDLTTEDIKGINERLRQFEEAQGLTRPTTAPATSLTPAQEYASRLEGVASCADAGARLQTLPNALPLFGGRERLTKDEFETQDQFVDRVRSSISSKLGGARLLVLRTRLPESALTYDAETQVFKASSYYLSSPVEKFLESVLGSRLLGFSLFEGRYSSMFGDISVPVPIGEARATKSSTDMVLVTPVASIEVKPHSSLGSYSNVRLGRRCIFLVSSGRTLWSDHS